MNPQKEKPRNITEYINTAPVEAQEKLREMLDCLRKAAPGAEESLKWGQPAFSYKWIQFQFAGFRHHVSFYTTRSTIAAFEQELSAYKTSDVTIQFPLDQPLPCALIYKIAVFRVQESTEKGVKWM